MSLSLAQLQAEFSQALRYQTEGESCAVVSNHFSATQRIQIYRNNYVLSLTEVMRASYPLCEQLVGEECFNQMARQHILTSPPTQADVASYGEGFEHTILLFPTVLEAAPYLTEVARFEWLVDQLNRQSKHDLTGVMPLARLSQLPVEQQEYVVFHLHHHVCIHSSFSLLSLQAAIARQDFDGLELNQEQYGVCIDNQQPSLNYHIITVELYQLIGELGNRQPLATIDPLLLQHLDSLLKLDLIKGFSLASDG